MRRRLTYTILAVAGAVVAFLIWSAWRNSRVLSDQEMLLRLPTSDGVVLAIDVARIRHSDLFDELTGSKAMQDADYTAFVRDSGFDYRKDLDEVYASFTPAGNFFVVRGRFDWKKLEAYARQSGGNCYNKLCHMPGSTPERRISFLPLAQDVMGLAVSTEELAASRLLHAGSQRSIKTPPQPVWVSIPGSSLARTSQGIPGASLLARSVSGVDDLVLTLGPQGTGSKATNFALELEAECRTAQDAETLTGQLKAYTSILKAALDHEKKPPDPSDLSGVLTAGRFHQSDRSVYGEWTLDKSFLDHLAGEMR